MCYRCMEMVKMGEMTQRFGYMDVKQSSKIRGRKLKTWRRKWVVFTKMSDLSSFEVVGKLDLYDNEEKWRTDPRNKLTFILEHVTSVRRSSSRTHPHAFEIVDRQPTFVLSGTTELESYSWLLTLKQVFTPEMVESTKDSYIVVIQPNDDSRKWKLEGEYNLNVSQNGVSLIEQGNVEGNVKITWGLSTLMRFNMERGPKSAEIKILSIKCGIISPTGESTFNFISDEVEEIIKTIRHHICVVLADKQNIRREGNNRIRSISATYSENNFMTLLDHQPVFRDQLRDRSDSDSSGSLLSPTSSPVIGFVASDPLVRSDSYLRAGSYKSNPNLGVLDEVEEHTNPNKEGLNEKDRQDSGCCSEIVSFENHDICGSLASEEVITTSETTDHGYSVIKDVSSANKASNDPIYHVPKNTSVDEIPVPRISAQVSEELVLPGSFEDPYHQLGANNKLESSDSEEQDHWPSTSSLEGNGEKRADVIYQEVDKIRTSFKLADLPTTPGNLNRRRSSSTPDLSAFWKKHGFDPGFENVYEELDEHRRLFFRKSQNKRKEVPPALPARPFTMNFSTAPKDNYNQPVVRLKKSLLGRSYAGKEKQQNSESKSPGQKAKTCSCPSPNQTKSRNNSKKSTCNDCGGDIKSAFNMAPIQFAVIPGSPLSHKNRNDKSPKIPTAETKQKQETGEPSPIFGNGTGILIDIDSDDVTNRPIPSPFRYDTPVTRPCSKEDPLIGFFLDDRTFDTNPLVTGELVAQPRGWNSMKYSNEARSRDDHRNMNSVHHSNCRLQLTHQRSLPTPMQESPLLPTRQRSLTNSPPKAAAFMNESFLMGAWATSSIDSCQSESLATTSSNPFESVKSDRSQTPGTNSIPPFNATFPDVFSIQTDPIIPTSTSNNNFPHDNAYMAMSSRSETAHSLENPTNPFLLTPLKTPTPTPFDPFMSIQDENWEPFDFNDNLNSIFIEPSNSLERETNNDNIYVTPGMVGSLI